jgi:hypothetical protein
VAKHPKCRIYGTPQVLPQKQRRQLKTHGGTK